MASERMGKLDGKVVVVTGASRGIGADIAQLFAAEGGRIVCAARTLREGEHPLAGSLETTVATIRQAGNGPAPSPRTSRSRRNARR
jgi:NAD(P)-dependent dehydrogenase (short-subunit alcohol dehydrogenase family)